MAVEVLDLLAAIEEIDRQERRVADLTDQVDYWMGKEQTLAARVRELEATLARVINASRQYAESERLREHYALHMRTLRECEDVLKGEP